MQSGDKEHKDLIKAASNNIISCSICTRHCWNADHPAGPVRYKYINPHNLLTHMATRHSYQPPHWWEFWR